MSDQQIKRTNWYNVQRIDVEDIKQDQDYVREKVRRVAQDTVAGGVATGLKVVADTITLKQTDTTNYLVLPLERKRFLLPTEPVGTRYTNTLIAQKFYAFTNNIQRIDLFAQATQALTDTCKVLIEIRELQNPTDIGSYVTETVLFSKTLLGSEIPVTTNTIIIDASSWNNNLGVSLTVGKYYGLYVKVTNENPVYPETNLIKFFTSADSVDLETFDEFSLDDYYTWAYQEVGGRDKYYWKQGIVDENGAINKFRLAFKIYSTTVVVEPGTLYINGEQVIVAETVRGINLVAPKEENYISIAHKETYSDPELHWRSNNIVASTILEDFEIGVWTKQQWQNNVDKLTNHLLAVVKDVNTPSFQEEHYLESGTNLLFRTWADPTVTVPSENALAFQTLHPTQFIFYSGDTPKTINGINVDNVYVNVVFNGTTVKRLEATVVAGTETATTKDWYAFLPTDDVSLLLPTTQFDYIAKTSDAKYWHIAVPPIEETIDVVPTPPFIVGLAVGDSTVTLNTNLGAAIDFASISMFNKDTGTKYNITKHEIQYDSTKGKDVSVLTFRPTIKETGTYIIKAFWQPQFVIVKNRAFSVTPTVHERARKLLGPLNGKPISWDNDGKEIRIQINNEIWDITDNALLPSGKSPDGGKNDDLASDQRSDPTYIDGVDLTQIRFTVILQVKDTDPTRIGITSQWVWTAVTADPNTRQIILTNDEHLRSDCRTRGRNGTSVTIPFGPTDNQISLKLKSEGGDIEDDLSNLIILRTEDSLLPDEHLNILTSSQNFYTYVNNIVKQNAHRDVPYTFDITEGTSVADLSFYHGGYTWFFQVTEGSGILTIYNVSRISATGPTKLLHVKGQPGITSWDLLTDSSIIFDDDEGIELSFKWNGANLVYVSEYIRKETKNLPYSFKLSDQLSSADYEFYHGGYHWTYSLNTSAYPDVLIQNVIKEKIDGDVTCHIKGDVTTSITLSTDEEAIFYDDEQYYIKFRWDGENILFVEEKVLDKKDLPYTYNLTKQNTSDDWTFYYSGYKFKFNASAVAETVTISDVYWVDPEEIADVQLHLKSDPSVYTWSSVGLGETIFADDVHNLYIKVKWNGFEYLTISEYDITKKELPYNFDFDIENNPNEFTVYHNAYSWYVNVDRSGATPKVALIRNSDSIVDCYVKGNPFTLEYTFTEAFDSVIFTDGENNYIELKWNGNNILSVKEVQIAKKDLPYTYNLSVDNTYEDWYFYYGGYKWIFTISTVGPNKEVSNVIRINNDDSLSAPLYVRGTTDTSYIFSTAYDEVVFDDSETTFKFGIRFRWDGVSLLSVEESHNQVNGYGMFLISGSTPEFGGTSEPIEIPCGFKPKSATISFALHCCCENEGNEARVGIEPIGEVDGENTIFHTPEYYKQNTLALYKKDTETLTGSVFGWKWDFMMVTNSLPFRGEYGYCAQGFTNIVRLDKDSTVKKVVWGASKIYSEVITSEAARNNVITPIYYTAFTGQGTQSLIPPYFYDPSCDFIELDVRAGDILQLQDGVSGHDRLWTTILEVVDEHNLVLLSLMPVGEMITYTVWKKLASPFFPTHAVDYTNSLTDLRENNFKQDTVFAIVDPYFEGHNTSLATRPYLVYPFVEIWTDDDVNFLEWEWNIVGVTGGGLIPTPAECHDGMRYVPAGTKIQEVSYTALVTPQEDDAPGEFDPIVTGTPTNIPTADKIEDSGVDFVTLGVKNFDVIYNDTSRKWSLVNNVAYHSLDMVHAIFTVASPPTETYAVYRIQTPTSGSTTSASSFKLIDGEASFNKNVIEKYNLVWNISDNLWSYVVTVDSTSQITLAHDIFTLSSKNYAIFHRQGTSPTMSKVIVGTADANTNLSDSSLIGKAENFITRGVQVGDIVWNATTNQYTTVVSVVSESVISLPGDFFAPGDTYIIILQGARLRMVYYDLNNPVTGMNDAPSPYVLIDNTPGQDFSVNASIGDIVFNGTTNQWAKIIDIPATTQVNLDRDIFTTAGNIYQVWRTFALIEYPLEYTKYQGSTKEMAFETTTGDTLFMLYDDSSFATPFVEDRVGLLKPRVALLTENSDKVVTTWQCDTVGGFGGHYPYTDIGKDGLFSAAYDVRLEKVVYSALKCSVSNINSLQLMYCLPGTASWQVAADLPFNPDATTIDTVTKLLLHFDGIDGSNTIIDSSTYNHTVVAYDNAHLESSSKKFGVTSLELDGLSDDHIQVAPSDLWNFEANDFTIDFWFKFKSLPVIDGTYMPFYHLGTSSTDFQNLSFYRETASSFKFVYQVQSGGSLIFSVTGASHSSFDNDWHHLALVRNGNVFTIYLDGISEGSNSSTLTLPTLSSNLYIGKNPISSSLLDGFIDEYRITYNALWTSDFTPPATAYIIPDSALGYYNVITSFKRNTFPANTLFALRDNTRDYYTLSLSLTEQANIQLYFNYGGGGTGAYRLKRNVDYIEIDSSTFETIGKYPRGCQLLCDYVKSNTYRNFIYGYGSGSGEEPEVQCTLMKVGALTDDSFMIEYSLTPDNIEEWVFVNYLAHE